MSTGRRTHTPSSRSARPPGTPPLQHALDSSWFPVSPTSTPTSSFAPSFSVSTPSTGYAPSLTGIDTSDASDILDMAYSMNSLRFGFDPDLDDMPRPRTPPIMLAPFPNPVTPRKKNVPSMPSTPSSAAPPRTPASAAPRTPGSTAPQARARVHGAAALPPPLVFQSASAAPPASSAESRPASPTKSRPAPVQHVDKPLSREQVLELIERFEDPIIRDLLARATAGDNQENIALAQIVHMWHVVDWNTRLAILKVLREEIWNRARLMDRLTDTSTCVFVVEPTVQDGTVWIDPAHTPVVHVYTPRALKTGSQHAQYAHRVMESVWRHGIAAPHVAGFRARVEHHMADHSRYRNLPVLTLTNNVHPTRFIIPPPSASSASAAEPTHDALRATNRRQRVATHGLPELPNFVAYAATLKLTPAQKEHVKNVVLDTQLTCTGFDEWTRIFHRDYDIDPIRAAKLAFLAIKDCHAENWPL